MDASIKIIAEFIDKASPGLKKLQGNLEAVQKQMQSVNSAIQGIAGALMIRQLAQMVTNAANAADAMEELAQSAGVTTEEFSSMAGAAALAGVDAQTMATSINQLNKSIVEANNPASAGAAAFKYLGISVKDASGKYKDANTIMGEVADKFANMPNGVNKSAVALEIFGKAGAKLIPFLNEGKAGIEAYANKLRELGLIITDEVGGNADQFTKAISLMNSVVESVALKVSQSLSPVLKNLSEVMYDLAVKRKDDIEAFGRGVTSVFKFLVKSAAGVVFALRTIGNAALALVQSAISLASLDAEGAKQAWTWFGEEFSKGADDLTSLRDALDNTTESTDKNTKATKDGTTAAKDYTGATKDSTAAKDAEAKAFEKAYAAMVKTIDSTNDLTAAQQVELNIAKKVQGYRTTAHQERMRQIAAEVDAARQLSVIADNTLQQNIAMVTADENGYQAASNNLQLMADTIKYGSVIAGVYQEQRVAVQALEAQYKALSITLQELEKDPANNTKKIEDTRAAIDGILGALNSSSGKLKDNLSDYATFTAISKQTLSTFQTYIGSARDKTKELSEATRLTQLWLSKGEISANEFAVAVEKINEEKFANMRANVTALQRKVADVAATIQSTLGDTFYNIMQGNFKDIGEMFKQMLDRMVADALAANLAKMLFGDFTNTGSVSGTGGGLLTAGVNALLGAGFGRESGGPVTAGQAYIVGERRPELFIPQTNGTIMPDTSAINGGGGNQINFSITAMDSQDVIRAMDKIKRPLTEMINGTNKSYNMR